MKTYRTVKAVLRDKSGNVLLLRRSKTHPTQGLQMDLPGGIIEEGEQPLSTLCREIEEETGLKISENAFKLVFAFAEVHDKQNAIRIVYELQLNEETPDIKLSWEHDVFEWCPLEPAINKLEDGSYKKRALQYLQEHNVLEDL